MEILLLLLTLAFNSRETPDFTIKPGVDFACETVLPIALCYLHTPAMQDTVDTTQGSLAQRADSLQLQRYSQ